MADPLYQLQDTRQAWARVPTLPAHELTAAEVAARGFALAECRCGRRYYARFNYCPDCGRETLGDETMHVATVLEAIADIARVHLLVDEFGHANQAAAKAARLPTFARLEREYMDEIASIEERICAIVEPYEVDVTQVWDVVADVLAGHPKPWVGAYCDYCEVWDGPCECDYHDAEELAL